MSKRNKIGPKLKSYSVDPEKQTILKGLIGLGFLIAFIGIIGYINISIGTSSSSFSQEEFKWIGLLIIGLLIAVISWLTKRSNLQKQIDVHRDGIAWRKGHNVQYHPWEEVESIRTQLVHRYFGGRRLWTTHYYQVQFAGGDILSFGNAYRDVEDLAKFVKKKVLPVLYRRIADKYNAGKHVDFGDVGISRDRGVKIGKKTIPWDAINRVFVKNGVLYIEKAGERKRLSIKLALVPNADILVTMLNQITKSDTL